MPADRGTLRDIAATLAIVGGFGLAATLALCHGRRPDEARSRCETILDRYVEMRQRAADPTALPHVVEDRQAAARERARAEGALARCTRELTRESAECAERARTADEIERCFP